MEIFTPSNAREAALREKCAGLKCPFAGMLEILPDFKQDAFESLKRSLQAAFDQGLYSLLITGSYRTHMQEISAICQPLQRFGLVVVLKDPDKEETKLWGADQEKIISEEPAVNRSDAEMLLQNEQTQKELSSLRHLLGKTIEPGNNGTGSGRFNCYAGQCEFYLNSDNVLRPCKWITASDCQFDLNQMDFVDAWDRMISAVGSHPMHCQDCLTCRLRAYCPSCPGNCYQETGNFGLKPEKLCRETEEKLSLLWQRYLKLLKETNGSADSPRISVIVPVYNCRPYISKCIESIMLQTLSDIEILLVDDGSTDGSGEICDRYAGKDSRIHVFHQKNSGVSAARNTGIRNSRGRYIMFCDSDDYVYDFWCALMLDKLMKYPQAMIIGNTYFGKNPDTQKISVRLEADIPEKIPVSMVKNMPLYAYVWDKIYRREILMDHQILFDEAVFFDEDTVFNEEYLRYCDSGVFIEQPSSYHLIREGSLVNTTPHDSSYDPLEHGRIVYR